MSTVIKVENVSKQYRLGLVGTGTMRDDLEGWWYRVRGKEDPTLKLGETNDRTSSGDSNYVWALRDINFEVKQGEVLGIIGKNGAGKSTLLKLLSRVTAPTIGNIKVKGRIASLLEVGTGFHPELTGKENIFLNGAIMGMKKHEIARKLDEIVDFAGVERYLETPVKRYSSGMYVRLAFAVAAHLEPEILIVDEVLAVGDADFQKKALGKMKEVSSGQGRTVLFVSHNMDSLRTLCPNAILLENGHVKINGTTDSVLAHYLANRSQENHRLVENRNKEVTLQGVVITDRLGRHSKVLNMGESFTVDIHYLSTRRLKNASIAIGFDDEHDIRMTTYWTEFQRQRIDLQTGESIIRFSIPNLKLLPGTYSINTYCEIQGVVHESTLRAEKILVVLDSIEIGFANPSKSQGHGSFIDAFQFEIINL
jgi:lipopolysaccharide transport system ATP-binding protein